MRLTKAALTAHVATIETMRETWIPRVADIIARQLRPTRDVDLSAMGTHMKSERDAWITTVRQAYETVGAAFATHSLADLAKRAGVEDDFDASGKRYRAGYNAFVNTYLDNVVADYVDDIHASFVAKLADLRDATATKALVEGVARPRPKPRPLPRPRPVPASDAATPYPSTEGATDYSDLPTGISEGTPDFNGLVDGLFESVGMVVGGMIAVTASNLGPLASASAFSDVTGTELEKVWSAVGDAKTRETHAAANGQTQALSDPFQVGDSLMLFPLDPSLGADISEILFCRCVELFDVVSVAKARSYRPRNWAERLRETVVWNLPRVAEREAYRA